MALPPAPAPDRSGPAPGAPRGLARATALVAAVAVAGFVVAGVLLAIPVRTPGVQDCGAPAAYLLGGRVDAIPDPEDRILGPDGEIVTLDAAVADTARSRPCQDRVASRAVPALLVLTGAFVLGVAAFAAELFVVRPRTRRARAAYFAAREGPATGPPPSPPPPD